MVSTTYLPIWFYLLGLMPIKSPNKFLVSYQDYANRSIISECRDSGTFTPTALKCVPIPCTQEDIINTTRVNGTFFTAETAETIDVDDTVTFECTDDDKVPNNGLDDIEVRCLQGGWFDEPDWPGN